MILQIKFQNLGCQRAVSSTNPEATQLGSHPILYSLWIQSHSTSAMIQANKTGATSSASFQCDSLLNQSLAWAHQIGWNYVSSGALTVRARLGREGEFWIELKHHKEVGMGVEIVHPQNPLQLITVIYIIYGDSVPLSYLEILCVSEACEI